MSQKSKCKIFIPISIIWLLLLFGCQAGTPVSTPKEVITSSPTKPKTMTSVPGTVAVPSLTPTLNTKTPSINPDDFFSISGLEIMNTPNSPDFCEHIPSPEIIKNGNDLSVIGKFSLCIWTAWQHLVKPVIDLDQGTLVSADDPEGDIALAMAHQGLDGVARYYVMGVNNAKIDEIEADSLSFSRCEDLLESLDRNDSGILNVHEGALACVMTTENQVALIKVDNIYPLETQAVGFSFSVLRK